ncbi:hypothetical protein DL96DRAFT_1703121 [Flagelloscypha sp. PMI_526]|nr:hypothetical protein DL96DRAFT_1703121 [Flagelloscypha sp. PMI_526]
MTSVQAAEDEQLLADHSELRSSPSNEQNDDNNLVESLKKNCCNWAKGTKKEILQPYIEAFADARAISLCRAWDVVRMAEAHYNSLYPYDCVDDYEPPRLLLQFNPDSLPVPAHLSEEESAGRAAVYTAHGNSIYRWIAYRAGLVVRSFSFGKGYEHQMNPILQLLVKLSRVKKTFRKRSMWMEYGVANSAAIEALVKDCWDTKKKDEKLDKNDGKHAGFQNAIIRECFSTLSAEEKAHWAKVAEETVNEKRDAYLCELNCPLW